MRALLVTRPERTSFLPMVPLAWALRAAGHEVRVASQPHFAGVIAGAGLPAVPVGRDVDLWALQARSREGRWRPPRGLPAPYDAVERATPPPAETLVRQYRDAVRVWHARSVGPTVAGLVGFARAWRPQLVVWEALAYAGPLAARASGAAHARMLWSVDAFARTREILWAIAGPGHEDPLAAWVAGYAEHYGLDFDEELLTGQVTLDPLPACLGIAADAVTYQPVRPVGYGGAASVAPWLRRRPRRPRVAVTLGLNLAEHGAGYMVGVPDLLRSVASLGVEVIATVSTTALAGLGTLPDRVTVTPFAPLPELVPTCRVVVHHGGFGTLLATSAAGVPQLVLPWEFDEPALARALVRRGAGLTIPAPQATGEQVREHVDRLLADPACRRGAGELGAEIRAMPTPHEVVGRLERLAQTTPTVPTAPTVPTTPTVPTAPTVPTTPTG